MKLQLMVLLAAITFAGTAAAQELDDDPFGFDEIAAKDLGDAEADQTSRTSEPI